VTWKGPGAVTEEAGVNYGLQGLHSAGPRLPGGEKRRAPGLAMAVLAALVLLFPAGAEAVPVTFDWGSYSPTGSTSYGVYDVGGTVVLQTGDLVQLISAGPDGQINAPALDGTPTGDDQLLQVGAIQNGSPLPPSMQNLGYIPQKTFTFDSSDPRVGYQVYIRAWNGATPAAATAAGTSGLSPLTAGGVFNATGWSTGTPTSVDVASFAASGSDTAIHLIWVTANEIQRAGFNLWRGTTADGPYERINADLIRASGDLLTGGEYAYDDADVSPGVPYFYRLEAVDVHGNGAFYGPVRATAGPHLAVYMPLVMH
jgi:hypothetical protein